MTKVQILPPDPSRLIEGLRDTGYDFNTALADIIDNSVDAKATKVRVRLRMDFDGDVSVSVADDGHGMDEGALLNAMTYGAKGKKDKTCLGKFGLGLKTASTAFCRRLSVVTRGSGEDAPVLKATWDLDHVTNKKEWEVLIAKPATEEIELLDEAAKGGSGTLVVWEKVDRLLKDYENPTGVHAKKALRSFADGFRDHASMVYQRFLDPDDARERTMEMVINDEAVDAWDPFCRKNKQAEMVANKKVPVDFDGGSAEFTISAFVLPRREEFDSPQAAKDARLENKMQGIYVYRENRLIHSADWLGMFSKEPHFSLLRVEFSFDHQLDDAFNVDIKKSRILLNGDLYNYVMTKFLPAPRRAAEERYRKGEKKKAQEKAHNAHASSNAAISAKEADLSLANVTVTNAGKGEVEIKNKQGTFRIKMPVGTANESGQVHVQPVPSIDDGMLWEPCIIDGHHGVRVNTGHAYYHKVYVPNLASGVTIQGMDSLLWALAESELGATTDGTRKHFKELRFEIARLLRNLVEDLPEPDMEASSENA